MFFLFLGLELSTIQSADKCTRKTNQTLFESFIHLRPNIGAIVDFPITHNTNKNFADYAPRRQQADTNKTQTSPLLSVPHVDNKQTRTQPSLCANEISTHLFCLMLFRTHDKCLTTKNEHNPLERVQESSDLQSLGKPSAECVGKLDLT